MSQYAHLSELDPELAPTLAMLPSDAEVVDVQSIRATMAAWTPVKQRMQQAQLPPESAYRIGDHTVPVEGGSITVRSLIPTPQGAGEDETFPLLFWMHGGGFSVGTIDMDDYYLRRVCVERQISILNVEYRLAPENPWPTGLDDCYTALKWAASNSSLFRASLQKGFIVGGLSSGANLTAVIAHRAKKDIFFEGKSITGQLLQVPFLLHPDAHPEEYQSDLLSMEQNKDAPLLPRHHLVQLAEIAKLPKTDPDFAVLLNPDRKNLAPAYIQVAGLDILRDEGLLYEKLLREAGVKTKLEIYPGLPHGGSMLLTNAKIVQKFIGDSLDGLQWLLDGAK